MRRLLVVLLVLLFAGVGYAKGGGGGGGHSSGGGGHSSGGSHVSSSGSKSSGSVSTSSFRSGGSMGGWTGRATSSSAMRSASGGSVDMGHYSVTRITPVRGGTAHIGVIEGRSWSSTRPLRVYSTERVTRVEHYHYYEPSYHRTVVFVHSGPAGYWAPGYTSSGYYSNPDESGPPANGPAPHLSAKAEVWRQAHLASCTDKDPLMCQLLADPCMTALQRYDVARDVKDKALGMTVYSDWSDPEVRANAVALDQWLQAHPKLPDEGTLGLLFGGDDYYSDDPDDACFDEPLSAGDSGHGVATALVVASVVADFLLDDD